MSTLDRREDECPGSVECRESLEEREVLGSTYEAGREDLLVGEDLVGLLAGDEGSVYGGGCSKSSRARSSRLSSGNAFFEDGFLPLKNFIWAKGRIIP